MTPKQSKLSGSSTKQKSTPMKTSELQSDSDVLLIRLKKEVKKEVETKLDFTTDIEFIMKSVKRKAG